MDYSNIQRLLDKYWEGETSLQEETRLRTFFNKEDVPEELLKFQPLFQFFQLEHEKHLDKHFDQKVIERLKPAENQSLRLRMFSSYLTRIAAVGLLLIGVYFLVNQNQNFQQDPLAEYEEMDPAEAYAKTKAALMLVSTKLHKGRNKANEGMNKMKKATQVIK